jgi:hypothetical protein
MPSDIYRRSGGRPSRIGVGVLSGSGDSDGALIVRGGDMVIASEVDVACRIDKSGEGSACSDVSPDLEHPLHPIVMNNRVIIVILLIQFMNCLLSLIDSDCSRFGKSLRCRVFFPLQSKI